MSIPAIVGISFCVSVFIGLVVFAIAMGKSAKMADDMRIDMWECEEHGTDTNNHR